MILCIIICGITLNARIGDTYEQSVKRYGKPLNYFKDEYGEAGLFCKNDLAVFVMYQNGCSYRENYTVLKPHLMPQLLKHKSFSDKLNFLDKLKNTEKIDNEFLDSILQDNLKSKWHKSKNLSPQWAVYFAMSGNEKFIAILYSCSRNQLVVEKLTSFQKNVSKKQIESAKEICVPLFSKYSKYVKTWGSPYSYYSYKQVAFEKNNYIVNVTFAVDFNKYYNNGVNSSIDETFNESSSTEMFIQMLNKDAIKKFAAKFFGWRKEYQKFSLLKKNIADKEDLFTPNMSRFVRLKDNQTSIPQVLIRTILESTTKTKWTPYLQKNIGWIRYTTWTNGRCMLASTTLLVNVFGWMQ